jgi:hypothetical protein
MTPIDVLKDPEEKLPAGVLPQAAAGVVSVANADVDPVPIGDPDNDEGYDDDEDDDEDEEEDEDDEEPLQCCCASDRALTPAARSPGRGAPPRLRSPVISSAKEASSSHRRP